MIKPSTEKRADVTQFDNQPTLQPLIPQQISDDLEFTVYGVTFKMKYVQGGTFSMGREESDAEAWDGERPIHTVTLSHDYYIGETEVTQGLWKAVMGSNPSYEDCGIGDNLPVNYVSWNDCHDFIRELNNETGKNFRLPTEAEWEYAASGGSKSRGYKYCGSNIIGDVAWFEDNSDGKVHLVKSKSPNELGIYDMSGNVLEWCEDWFDYYPVESVYDPVGPSLSSGWGRVMRGGSWDGNENECRVVSRDYDVRYAPEYLLTLVGMRLLLCSQ